MIRLDRDLRKWRKRLGDSNKQGMLRVAVGAAREAAVLTQPKGKSKKQSVGAIVTGARVAVKGVNATQFNRMDRAKSPRVRIRGRWVSVDSDQMLHSEKDVDAFIESNRGARGHARNLPAEEKGIAKKVVLQRVITRRKKLAGKAKGSWLGAGRDAARKQRGGQQLNIGKNFMGWAQKHADMGRARVRNPLLRKGHVRLISEARHTRDEYVFPRDIGRRAVVVGWRKTIAWYRRAAKQTTK